MSRKKKQRKNNENMKLKMKVRVGMLSEADYAGAGLGSFHCILHRVFQYRMTSYHHHYYKLTVAHSVLIV